MVKDNDYKMNKVGFEVFSAVAPSVNFLLYNDRSLKRRHPAEGHAFVQVGPPFLVTQTCVGARQSPCYLRSEASWLPETPGPVDSLLPQRRAGQETRCHSLWVSPRLPPLAALSRARHRGQRHAPPLAVLVIPGFFQSKRRPVGDFR